MKKLLIIKTGTAGLNIYKEHGDFEDQILSHLDINPGMGLIRKKSTAQLRKILMEVSSSKNL